MEHAFLNQIHNICWILALLKLAQSFMAHKAPLRVGVVFCSEFSGISNSLDDDAAESRGDVIRRLMNQAAASGDDGQVKKIFRHIVNV